MWVGLGITSPDVIPLCKIRYWSSLKPLTQSWTVTGLRSYQQSTKLSDPRCSRIQLEAGCRLLRYPEFEELTELIPSKTVTVPMYDLQVSHVMHTIQERSSNFEQQYHPNYWTSGQLLTDCNWLATSQNHWKLIMYGRQLASVWVPGPKKQCMDIYIVCFLEFRLGNTLGPFFKPLILSGKGVAALVLQIILIGSLSDPERFHL
jgi:hypothetical protein